jgi:DNA polymerase III epsilon subunit-like protein
MNYNNFCFLDFETTSVNPYKCQPIQLAATIIDSRKLEILEDSLFTSFISPIWDEEKCIKHGLDPVTEEVLKITGITKEQLLDAPPLRSVWEQFVQYVNKYNPKKSKWGSTIKAGMNIDKYDNIIVDRICGGNFRFARNQLDLLLERGIIEKEIVKAVSQLDLYGFGPWDKDRGEETLFYPRDSIDLMRIIWMWTENRMDIKKISMDAVREWLGISKAGAHNAAKDVMDGAKVLIKFLKLHRNFGPRVKFKGSCADE